MDKLIHKQVAAVVDEVTELRRWLHRHAELSFAEHATAAHLEERLNALGGLAVSRPTPTSVMAVLKTGRPGKTVALRADIDALPICEPPGLDFASENKGAMHACGHDAHAAMQFGAAKVLLQNKDRLRGEVRFLFQHAEELPPGGAIEMLKAGVMEGVDEVYGMHVTTALPTGKFGICRGVLTSNTDGFSITVNGKGGHSAMPETCIDPVLAGCEIVTALQSIASRRVAPDEPMVLSVCRVQAGTAYNIIPDEFMMEGSVRTFSAETRERVQALIGEIAGGVAKAHGAAVTYRFNRGYDAVYNDPGLSDAAEKAVDDAFGKDAAVHIRPVMPGEDFGYFSSVCRGFFMELGTASAEKNSTAPHHNPAFRIDEDCLRFGMEYTVSLLLNRME